VVRPVSRRSLLNFFPFFPFSFFQIKFTKRISSTQVFLTNLLTTKL
jgi:hypothetical protein